MQNFGFFFHAALLAAKTQEIWAAWPEKISQSATSKLIAKFS
jgi:hypothetical protein